MQQLQFDFAPGRKEKLKEMKHRFGLPLPGEYNLSTSNKVDPDYVAPRPRACWARKVVQQNSKE